MLMEAKRDTVPVPEGRGHAGPERGDVVGSPHHVDCGT